MCFFGPLFLHFSLRIRTRFNGKGLQEGSCKNPATMEKVQGASGFVPFFTMPVSDALWVNTTYFRMSQIRSGCLDGRHTPEPPWLHQLRSIRGLRPRTGGSFMRSSSCPIPFLGKIIRVSGCLIEYVCPGSSKVMATRVEIPIGFKHM